MYLSEPSKLLIIRHLYRIVWCFCLAFIYECMAIVPEFGTFKITSSEKFGKRPTAVIVKRTCLESIHVRLLHI